MSNGMTRDIDLHDSLKYPKYKDPVITNQEINDIFTDREMCLKINKIEGRTIINLLGTDGDCEDVSKWSDYFSTHILDSTNKVFGNNGFKVTISSTLGCIQKNITTIIDKTKHYCLHGYLKNVNATNVYLAIYSGGVGARKSIEVTDSTKFNRVLVKIQPSDFGASTDIQVQVVSVGANGQYAYVDGIMLEEITQADYNNPNFQPSPYVSGDMSVGDVVTRVKSRGKNMINLVQGSYHPNAKLNTVTVGVTHKDVAIPVSPNTTYTVSLDKPMIYSIDEFDSNKNILSVYARWSATTTTGFSFTTGVNTKYICIAFAIDNAFSQTIYPENYQIMLNEGNVTLPYEPYEWTHADIQYPLRALPNGVKDTIEGNKLIKRVERIVLDGSLSWQYFDSFTGYKRVWVNNNIDSNALKNTISGYGYNYGYKYNNKALGGRLNAESIASDQCYIDFGYHGIFITIPNTDSGWGDSYTPTADEIKAYFNGWKMYDNVNPLNSYSSGTKAWVRIGAIVNGVYNDGGIISTTNTLPTTLSDRFTPYRLYYQLATPVPTELNMPNLVAYPGGNLIMESDSQSWVRPTVTYQIADNEKANIDEVMNQVSNNARLNNNQKPYCRIYQNINVVIPNATAFKVPFNTVDADNFGMFDKANNRIMIRENGIYDIKSCVGFDTNAVGFREILIKVNGALYIADSTILPVTNNPTSVVVATTKKLNVGEYIEIVAVQYSGSSISLRGDIPQFLSVIKVGD